MTSSRRELHGQDRAKRLVFSILMSIALVVSGWAAGLKDRSNFAQGYKSQASLLRYDSDDSLIVPGTRVGNLALGDAETKISELFPKPSISRSPSLPDCGMEYSIGVLKDASHPGALNVFAKDGKVVEMKTIQGTYHTAEGIRTGSSPEVVRHHYKELKSYLFLRETPEVLNESPLIIWLDAKKGIAFSFAHGPRDDSRFSVYSIIVFKPGSAFCEEDSVVPEPESWRELAPYSLHPPDTTARVR